MKNTYILDTSVLIYDPNSFKNFKNSTVIIPISVLDELDKLKTYSNEVGKNARVCIRELDRLCESGNIHKGTKVNDTILKIETSNHNITDFEDPNYTDNKIISCALSKQNNRNKVILVSRDINLRVKARSLNIEAQNYNGEKASIDDLYRGFTIIVDDCIGRDLQKKDLEIASYKDLANLGQNECVYIESKSGEGLALGRRFGDKLYCIKNRKPWGLSLRNKEQAFAADLLCDPRVPLVSLIGRAGTGKSICAIASALEMVLEQKRYNKFIIYRPIQPVGNDLGYLPGSQAEKLQPWMQPISDSFEVLFEAKNGNRWKNILDRYLNDDTIQMEAITYIRGRSIPNAFILLDEAQNTTPEEIKTILTRVGEGTKIVLTGDIEQIDNHNLDAINNGLTYVVEKFKDSELAGHITFSKGERSALASVASEIL